MEVKGGRKRWNSEKERQVEDRDNYREGRTRKREVEVRETNKW